MAEADAREQAKVEREVRKKVKDLFDEETLYTHDTWWKLFEKRDNGVPIAQLRAFGGVLDRDDLEQVVVKAFSGKGRDSGIVILDGYIRPEPRPSEDNHLYKRTVFATPIPFKATEEEIKNFFKQYGHIKRIDRREWKDMKDGLTRNKPGIYIIYTSADSAQRCVDAKPSYTKTNDIGKYLIPELTVSLRSDDKKSLPDKKLENKYVFKIRDAMNEQPDEVQGISAEAEEVLQLENIVVVEGAMGCSWRDIRGFTDAHLKSIRNDVVFTHLRKGSGTGYLFVKNAQNIDLTDLTSPISFREMSLTVRAATATDMEYLSTLPVASDETSNKKRRIE